MRQGGISPPLQTGKTEHKEIQVKSILIAVTDTGWEGTDFSGNLALSSSSHVQSTVLNDVNCSCECSALLQIKPHDFKHVINGHQGKVLSIGLAQPHTEILWLHQRENPVVYRGTQLGQKSTHTLPEIFYFSHQQSFFFQEQLKQKYHNVRLYLTIAETGRPSCHG